MAADYKTLDSLSESQLAIWYICKQFAAVPGKNRAFIRKCMDMEIADSDFEACKQAGVIKESKRGIVSLA